MWPRDEKKTTTNNSHLQWDRMGKRMSWAAPMALMSATILAMLSFTAPLPLAVIGWTWAGLHLLASLVAWNKR
jgi:hypothetical protein